MGRRGTKTYEERRLPRWIVDPPTGCWNWTGAKLNGYATEGRGRANRKMYERRRGTIPAGCDVHHTCLNPACVNPDHLEAKPKSKHVSDHQRTITTERALKIRELGAVGTPLYVISEQTGVSVPGIWKVLEAIRYPELGPPVVYQPSCAECGAPVVGRNRSAKFCSDACNNRHQAAKRRTRQANKRVAGHFHGGSEG